VGGGERKEVENKKSNHRLTTTLITTCTGQEEASPHDVSPEMEVGYFFGYRRRCHTPSK